MCYEPPSPGMSQKYFQHSSSSPKPPSSFFYWHTRPVVMIFLAITSAFPAIQHALVKNRRLRVCQCAYKSPQSRLAYRFGHMVLWFIHYLNFRWANESQRFHRLLKSTADLGWMVFDMRWRQLRDAEVVRGTAKTPRIRTISSMNNNTFTQSVDAVHPIQNPLPQGQAPRTQTIIPRVTLTAAYSEFPRCPAAVLRLALKSSKSLPPGLLRPSDTFDREHEIDVQILLYTYLLKCEAHLSKFRSFCQGSDHYMLMCTVGENKDAQQERQAF